MKLIINIAIATTAALILSGCGGQTNVNEQTSKVKPVIDETQLGYRDTSLDKNTEPPKVKYRDNYAGSGFKFKRAFQDAPPMIPHDTTGMLPITKDNNACLGCHMPEYAKSVGATPIPVSHFTNFRPSKSYAVEGKNTSDMGDLKNVSIKKLDHLYQGRYNCSQCHAPQANVKPLVDNKFKPVYTKPNGEFKSSWNDEEYLKDIDIKK